MATNDEQKRSSDGALAAAAPATGAEEAPGLRISRRTALVGGAVGLAATMGVGELDPSIALASTPSLTDSIPLPTGTAPEQLRSFFGADPAREMTVSWSAPGSVAMPAPTLAYSTSPLSASNRGTVVSMPPVTPFDLTAPRTRPTSNSFTDGLSGITTYHYHVPLRDLRPDTEYYYEISDGAATPSTASGSFRTAPADRAAYRFTAFGDIGTPYTDNPSGYTWKESSDTSLFTIDGALNPGDGKGPGLFHLMVGDLSYANVNPGNTPSIWRDYQYNASRVSSGRAWMPLQGNHEVELGSLAATGAAGSTGVYNGPYGAGNYLVRHLLPDNGLTNSDGNRLQGMFYSFRVGTVLFIMLDTNDVVWQTPQTGPSSTYAGTFESGTTLTASSAVTQYLATGQFAADANDIQQLPDTASGTPNLQTQWLERQLADARAPGSGIDMIVVCEHHAALSSGPNNGCDMGIRTAWLPLYDKYEVDLVLGGHDHDYERSYPVRGYDSDAAGTTTAAFTSPFGTYSDGEAINTRRPTVVAKEPTALPGGRQAWNTAQGTVFLQIGGAGAAGGPIPAIDPSDGLREAVVWATPGGVGGDQCATEDATWSAVYDSSDNYGYAVFDVNPGDRPDETTITYQWFQVPTVPNGGSVTLPTTPFEEFVFARLPRRSQVGAVTVRGTDRGRVAVGDTVTAEPYGWPRGTSFAYQWLANGAPIRGATGPSHAVTAAELGQRLEVQVAATASGTTETATSEPYTVVRPGFLQASRPRITGRPRVGETLRVLNGEWTPHTEFTYRWRLDGRPIPGATGTSLEVLPEYRGKRITVQVTGRRAGRQPVAVISAPTRRVPRFFPLNL